MSDPFDVGCLGAVVVAAAEDECPEIVATIRRHLPEGVALLEEAVADPGATGSANHPLFLAHLGEAHLLAGRLDEALAVARRALDLAHRQKERGNEAWVLRLLGEIAVHADPPDLESAEEHYRQALLRADELGLRPLVAHCHFGLGKLYRRPGNREEAPEHLTTAATMYREMGMTFGLGRRALRCLPVVVPGARPGGRQRERNAERERFAHRPRRPGAYARVSTPDQTLDALRAYTPGPRLAPDGVHRPRALPGGALPGAVT